MRFIVAGRSDIGRVREGNEDAYMTREPLFAVADGMGGHQGGEVASNLALDQLKKSMDGEMSLVLAVQEANRAVFEKASQDPGLAGMGTTLTAFVVEGDYLRMAHVGDSRAYLLRDGDLQRLTKDHTVVERLVEEGRLTQMEADMHPQRSILTRAIGAEGQVQVDQGTIEVRTGDRLLLCSDGLTGMVGEDDVQQILERHGDPQSAADALVDAANAAGGQDNVTVVVIDVADDDRPGLAPAPPSEAAPAGAKPGGAAPERIPRRRWRRAATWILVILVIIVGGLFALKRLFIDQQWFVGEANGHVALYRGIPAQPLGIDLADVIEERPDLPADQVMQLADYRELDQGITAASEEEARAIIAQIEADLAAQQAPPPPGAP